MFAKFMAVFAALFLGTLGAAALAVASAGFALVEVHNRDVNLTIPVPVGLVLLALTCVPEEAFRELPQPLLQNRRLVREAWEVLARCPDVTFVETESDGSRVTVSKRRGRLLIDVKTPDETVYVSVPVEAVSRIVNRLAAGGI